MAQPRNIRNYTSILRSNGFLLRNRRFFGMQVINLSGSDIPADSLVTLSGFDLTSKLVKVVLANAGTQNLASEVYVALQKITNTKKGNIFRGGLSAATLNTSGVTNVGDPVFLDVVSGGFTATAPTATNARVVLVGYTTVKSATVGQIAWDVQDAQKFGSNDITGSSPDGNTLVLTGTISSANITGVGAGQLGHANGVVLVPPGGATIINELVYAIVENDFLTAAYTGGGATGIKLGGGGVAVSNTATAAVIITNAADVSVEFVPPGAAITVANVYTLNNSLNLVSAAAPTQPGTAAGVIKWKIGFRAITSQLD
jgi:hypothetical protein